MKKVSALFIAVLMIVLCAAPAAAYYNAELFAGLDAENVKIVADLLKEKAQDALVVVITHENADVLGADKTIVMEKIK